jgi:hypothetical protein
MMRTILALALGLLTLGVCQAEPLPVPSDLWVDASRLDISKADFARIAGLKGLRVVVLPLVDAGRARLKHAEWSTRGCASYSVRYTRGGDWLDICAGTDGLGGPDIGKTLFSIPTRLLGDVAVGPMNYGQEKDWMLYGESIAEGSSNLEGKPVPLHLFFFSNPGADRAWLTRVIQSLRPVKL